MKYIEKFQGFDEVVMAEFSNTLSNGEEKVKGLTIRVSDEILAEVTSLLAQGEPFLDKVDPEEIRRESLDNDEFISDHQ
ncbi:hypothetical protein KI387_012955, partial [Taxus chinensis]